jgi:zinc and cadmium transporter
VEPWLPIALSASTFFSTLLGGYIAIRSQARLRYFFAFSAGTLLSIAFADLLPEAMNLSEGDALLREFTFYTIIASFVFFHVIERYVLVHEVHDHADTEDSKEFAHDHTHTVGGLGATGLIGHSFVDGIAIGAAFQANAAIGAIVALAVIAHDFADGVNTVTLTFRIARNRRRAFSFLLADAAAPVFGALTTLMIAVPQAALALLLAFFVGHFLYIGAADLLPEMHRGPRSYKALGVHLLGIVVIIALTRILSL